MLPAALKAKYEKKVRLGQGIKIEELPVKLHEFFKNEQFFSWEDALKNGLVPILQREAAKGHLEVIYEVKERLKKKYLKFVQPLVSETELEVEINALPQRAEKQKASITLFCSTS